MGEAKATNGRRGVPAPTRGIELDWRSISDGDTKRHAYMASRDWAIKKQAVRGRSGGLCERRCGNPAAQVHHQTYANLYREPLEDLLHVCRPCHEFLSGKTNVDPFLESPVRIDGEVVKTVYLAGKITGTNWRDELFAMNPDPDYSNEGGWSFENHSGIDNDALYGDWVTSPDCLTLPDKRRLSLTGPYWKVLQHLGGHGSIGPATEWVPREDRGPYEMKELVLDTAHAYVPLETVRGTGVVGRAAVEADALARELREFHAMVARTIRASDVLFAWIDSLDCYGTLHEIGLALGFGKVVLVACDRRLDLREIWLACHGGRKLIHADTCRIGWDAVWTYLEREGALGPPRLG